VKGSCFLAWLLLRKDEEAAVSGHCQLAGGGVEVVAADSGVGAEGVGSFSLSHLPNLGVLAKIQFVLYIVPAVGIHHLKRVSVVASNDSSLGLSHGKSIVQYICFKKLVEVVLDVLVDVNVKQWFSTVAHVPYFY
jgi:hypothetical protein